MQYKENNNPLSNADLQLITLSKIEHLKTKAATFSFVCYKSAALLLQEADDHALRTELFYKAAFYAYSARLYLEAIGCIEAWQKVPFDENLAPEHTSNLVSLKSLIFLTLQRLDAEKQLLLHPDYTELLEKMKSCNQI